MIIVIADDITGAAEIGGIGLQYGLKVLLSADVVDEAVDLLVIYTNTRSLSEGEAVNIMRELTKKAATLKPSLLYKKTDSVLRGHVLAELRVQMKELRLNKALLLPVNPHLGRTIKAGTYFINGVPVHEAGFANDPEFPIQSSRVQEMLKASNEMHVQSAVGPLPDGISVGEASTPQDVQGWASPRQEDLLYAGAASFFTALLQQRFALQKAEAIPHYSWPLLLISGTAYRHSHHKQNAFSGTISEMPEALFFDNDVEEEGVTAWANEAVMLLHKKYKCVMTIGNWQTRVDPNLLLRKLSVAAKQVLQTVPVKELWIEGGATAYAVIRELGFNEFVPTEEWEQGVVRMKVRDMADLHLTIKPGSYAWPEEWKSAFVE